MVMTPARRQTPTAIADTPFMDARRGALHHPQFGATVRYARIAQPSGDEEATAQTVALMSYFARADSHAEIVRRAALEATQGSRTPRDSAALIWRWIKARVQYDLDSRPAAPLEGVDAESAEVLIRPVDLLAMPAPAGDCDDFSMLCAAMLLAVGIEPQFKTIAAEADAPQLYSHVFVVAFLPGGQTISLDCSHGPVAGWEAPAAGKSRLWPVIETRSRLNGWTAGIDWGGLLKVGAEGGMSIAKERYGQAPAGTYRQGADGSVYYRQPQGAGDFAFPGVGVGVGSGMSVTTILILAVVVVVAVVAIKK